MTLFTLAPRHLTLVVPPCFRRKTATAEENARDSTHEIVTPGDSGTTISKSESKAAWAQYNKDQRGSPPAPGSPRSPVAADAAWAQYQKTLGGSNHTTTLPGGLELKDEAPPPPPPLEPEDVPPSDSAAQAQLQEEEAAARDQDEYGGDLDEETPASLPVNTSPAKH